MPQYRWLGSGPFTDNANDRVIESGDVVELDAHIADAHPEFVRVGADEAGSAEGVGVSDAASVSETAPDPSELTVDELRDALEDYDPDNTVALRNLREREREGKNRATAIEAIEAASDTEL